MKRTFNPLDRPSHRTPEEREQRYLTWLATRQSEDTPERRELFMRRYLRPQPPNLKGHSE